MASALPAQYGTFPGGVLPLKIFETRYIDMVRDCMKNETPFGVVLIKSGTEVGATAEPEAVGSLAHITQWDMENLGVLWLRTLGGERFRIRQTRVLPDRRLEARVEMLPGDVPAPISDMHLSCARALKIIIDDINASSKTEQVHGFDSPFVVPNKLDDAGWVANRWCEILPISAKAKQKLLNWTTRKAVLSVVHQYLQQHNIL